MKQLVQSVKSGEIRVLEVPPPQTLSGGVLVQVEHSLISAGTERTLTEFSRSSLLGKARKRPDLVKKVLQRARREGLSSAFEAVQQGLESPLALGYSCAGRVIDTKGDVGELKVGDLAACAGAGYASHAEVVSVPKNLAVKVPSGIGTDSACYAALGAIALQGVRMSGAKIGETSAVIGLGLVGQLSVQLLKASGCRVAALDPRAKRAALAKTLGADWISSEAEDFAELVEQATLGQGADSVIIAADTPDNQPVELAGQIARDRAIIAAVGAVGTRIPRNLYYEKELSFIVPRSLGPGRYDEEYESKGHDYPAGYVRWTENRNMATFLDLVAEGKVRTAPLTSCRFTIDQAPEAYRQVGDGKGNRLGVLFTYPGFPVQETATRRESLSATGSREPHQEIGIGVLGAGQFARSTLLPAIVRLKDEALHLRGVCSARGIHAKLAAEKFGFEFCSREEGEIVGHPRTDLVVIATRHHLHCRQVVAALEAGKHVFCEKPLCLNREELEAIERSYLGGRGDSPKPMLMVGFNRRFGSLSAGLKSFLEPVAEPMAVTYRINAGYLPPDHWTQDPSCGGGRIIGEACHFVDFMTFLVGQPPTRVSARALPDQGRYRGDNLAAILEFPDGSLGNIVYLANGSPRAPKERIEVSAGGRSAVLDDFRRLELIDQAKRSILRSRWRQDKGHQEQWKMLIRALRQGGPQPIPMGELVSTSLVTFAIQDSVKTRSPQTIEWPSRHGSSSDSTQ